MPSDLAWYNYLNFQHFIEMTCELNNNYWQLFGSLFFFLTGWDVRWVVVTRNGAN
jgi:hypothetical protein